MINKIKNNNKNKGQVAVIVLLASAIILTLGLSASKKAITDIKVDTDEELLKEAFNTAESGINNYLNNGSTTYSDSNGGSATINSTDIGTADTLTSEGKAQPNINQLFWLVDHDTQGKVGTTYYTKNVNLSIKVDNDFNGAIKIDYFYKNGANYGVSHSGYNFNMATPIVTGFVYSGSKTITFPIAAEDSLLLVITPLGGSTNITLSGPSAFPLQGEELTSVGTAGDGVKTQIKTRNIYQIPPFFLESITAKNIIQ